MITAARILDRGRLLLGLIFVVPVAVLVPSGAGPVLGGSSGPGWLATTEPNPIKAIQDPRDVVNVFTQRTVHGRQVVTAGGTTKDQVVAAAQAAGDGGEVGSDGSADGTTRASDPSPATPPGPVPVAIPSVSNYPAPPDARFVFPVVGGASFTDDWGGQRGGGAVHRGIDLFAAESTAVVAEVDGVVFNVGWNDVGGWRYWLRDQWGNEYYHAHLSAFSPAAVEGAQVRAGTVLGFVGNTGDAKATPSHLHFEIHPAGGDAIPPFGYLSSWQRVG